MTSYTLQTWKDQDRIHDDIAGLSHDAACHIAQVHSLLGNTVRLMSEITDYVEIYQNGYCVRQGTFAETTLVRV